MLVGNSGTCMTCFYFLILPTDSLDTSVEQQALLGVLQTMATPCSTPLVKLA